MVLSYFLLSAKAEERMMHVKNISESMERAVNQSELGVLLLGLRVVSAGRAPAYGGHANSYTGRTWRLRFSPR